MITQAHRTYPLFEKNQVLTHSQLNKMVSYLEEQERMTRTGLIGIGIVCGLEVTPDSAEKNAIRISEGLGITSEGDLLRLPECIVTQYRSYKFGTYLDYAPFQDDETGEQNVELWELLSEDFEDEESEEEILPLETMDLKRKVVVLFLEIHDRKLKSCLSRGCDEIGVERRLTVRKLLIDIDDLEKVLEKTGNREMTHFAKRFELEDYALKKARFTPPAGAYSTAGRITEVYADVLFSEENNPVDAILTHWRRAYNAFEPVLNSTYDENPFDSGAQQREAWERAFKEEVTDRLGIQYYYDFIRDLTLAYQEFREVSFDLLTECSPDSGLFPKHLILGEITDSCKPSPYRQQFIQTPVYSSQRQLLSKTRSLFARAVTMMNRFDTAVARRPENFPLRITPSIEKGALLSRRSIPFYYTGIAGNGDGKSLETLWDHNLARRCAAEGSVPAYENNRSDEAGGGAGDLTPVTGPLHYDLDRYNFFRIEGCLGKPCSEVMDELDQRIRAYNLPVGLEAVRVNSGSAPLDVTDIDYDSGFHDLHEDYTTFRYKLSGFLKSDLYAWELYRRYEEAMRRRDKDFRPPVPGEWHEMLEQVYKHVIEFLCLNLPTCIRDFIERFEELKDGYAAAIEFVFDRLLEEVDLRGIADLAYEIDGESGDNLFQEMVSLASRLLYQILDVLFFHPLYRIYYAYRRREFYHRKHLESRTRAFSQLLEEHPGLNHMAGVPEGGTFVLLYGEVEGRPQRVIGDFALPYRLCGDRDLRLPVCDDAEAREKIQVAPFARPDYGFTFMNRPVVIDLAGNDHDLYDLEGEYCESDGKTFLNLAVKEVKPVDKDSGRADMVILDDRRSVRFTPPEDVTGLFKFRYTLQNLSNGLTDSGVVTVLVSDYCIRTGDYTFEVQEGQTVSVVMPESILAREFRFDDPEYNPDILDMKNAGEEMSFKILKTPEKPYTIDYTATSPAEPFKGCGRITFVPLEKEQYMKLEDFYFAVRSGEDSFRAMFSKELVERGYQVHQTLHNADVMSVEIIKHGMLIRMKQMIESSQTFTYTAIAAGEPEGSGTVTVSPLKDIKVYYGDLTNDEIRKVLKERDIGSTQSEVKADLMKKLVESTSEQPLSMDELSGLSDRTLRRLGEKLNIEVSEANRSRTINALWKVLQ